MQKFETQSKSDNNFIGGWFLDNIDLCDELIELWNESPDKWQGKSGGGANRSVNKDIKDSIDISLYDTCQDERFKKYGTELTNVVQEYIKEFPYCSAGGGFSVQEGVNIQYYPPGGGFKAYHTERYNSSHPSVFRHLVFMTFLNDVKDGGGTEFYHQNITIPAKKGLTLIWPSDWTHTHRGIVSNTESKYIITGWFSFI